MNSGTFTMAQQQFAGMAVMIALAFLVMALSACATPAHVAHGPRDIASVQLPPATPEFHGARIGADTLRGELPSEN
jgi:hypothetical protein